MARQKLNPKRILERLRSNEPATALASDLELREAEVLLAREVVRKIGEHQANTAGRLPDSLAQAVVEAAVQIEHAGFLKVVAEHGSKGAASAARRGLSILRSRGIEVDVEPTGEAVFKAETQQPEELACFVSTHDTLGERLLWIPRPHRGGGLQLITLLLSDTRGITRVDSDEVNRKSFRRLRDDLMGGSAPHGIALTEIPLRRAKALIAEARQRSPRGLSIDDEALLLNLLGDPSEADSPLEHEPALPPELEQQRLRESGALHDEPEAAAWYPSEEATRALRLRLEEIATSSLYVDEQQRGAQAEVETSKAIATSFTPEVARRYAKRLFALAEALRQEGRAPASERAAATARALASGSDPAAIPFCRRLFEKLAGKPLPKADKAPEEPVVVS